MCFNHCIWEKNGVLITITHADVGFGIAVESCHHTGHIGVAKQAVGDNASEGADTVYFC